MNPNSRVDPPQFEPILPDARQQRVLRILVVDTYPLIRQGLERLFEQQPNLQICGEAQSAEQSLQQNASHHPDVTIVGIETQGAADLELIHALSRQCKSTNIMVISRCKDPQYIERTLRAGAVGFVCESASLEEIVHAVHEVSSGNVYICEPLRSQVIEQLQLGSQGSSFNRVRNLTDREFAVFALIAAGLTTRDIAESLHIGVKTVETHRHNIKRKLLLKNSTELAQFAVQWKMPNALGASTDIPSTVELGSIDN